MSQSEYIKPLGFTLILLIVWIMYWECSRPIRKRRPYNQLSRRLRRMLLMTDVPKLCARHLPHKQGKMSIVDANNCVKCKGRKK